MGNFQKILERSDEKYRSRKVVSFDFDGVLSYPVVQSYVEKLIKEFRVVVVTSRPHEISSKYQNNDDLYEVTDSLYIDRSDIIFTREFPKEEFLRNSRVIFHLDDDYETIKGIESIYDGPKAVLYDPEFQIKCDEILEKHRPKLSSTINVLGDIKYPPDMPDKTDVSDEALKIRQMWQDFPLTHGFTCMSYDGCDRNKQERHGMLKPTKEGWVCPCGKYKQDY